MGAKIKVLYKIQRRVPLLELSVFGWTVFLQPRAIIVSLIIGLVLVNVLYGLFYYISKLIKNKDNQRLLPLFIANAILLILIVLTVIAWKNGYIEERNQAINEVSIVETVKEMPTAQPDNATQDNSETSPSTGKPQ